MKNYTTNADLAGLMLNESAAPVLVYTRPGAPPLGEYSRFIVDPISVNYSDPEIVELSAEDVGRLQQTFRNAMITELTEAGYEVGTRSQPGTLRISFTLSGVKDPGGAANMVIMGAGAAVGLPGFAASVGEVTIEATFREAVSNRIDAVVINRSQGSRLFKNKPWSTWADVEGTFNNWAKGFRKAVDEAHGK